MYTEPESQLVSSLVPAKCYQYIFPATFDLRRISYYFEHQMGKTVTDDVYEELFGRVGAWQALWRQPVHPYLKYLKSLATISIFDGRSSEEQVFTYRGDAAGLYEYCAEARTPKDIAANFGDAPWIQDALNDFVGKELMLHLDGRYLSLALPENPYFEMSEIPERKAVVTATQPDAELIAQ
jgi:hypothetical protein